MVAEYPTQHEAYDRSYIHRGMVNYTLAVAFSLALFGYSVFAPYIQIIEPDGSRPAIILRAIVALACVTCLLIINNNKYRLYYLLWPVTIFFLLYTTRIYENFFIRNLQWQANPLTVFSFLIGGIFVPSICLSKTIHNIDEKIFSLVIIFLIIIFIFGLYLNLEYLLLSAKYGRANILKLNPISIGAAASSFALLLLVIRTNNIWLTFGKFLGISVLVGITAFVEARGPVVAGVFAVLVFFLMSHRAHRIMLLFVLIVIISILTVFSYNFDVDFVELTVRRFYSESEYYRGTGIGYSADARIKAFLLSLDQFYDNILFGNKVFEPYLLQYPHNIILESLISVGIIGTIFLFIHIVLCIRVCFLVFGSEDSTLIERFAAILFCKELMAVQFSGAVWSNLVFWISSICLLALGASRFPYKYGSMFRQDSRLGLSSSEVS